MNEPQISERPLIALFGSESASRVLMYLENSDGLERAGIVVTLSGGAAVSIYSENRFDSEDLDFVTVALVKELKGLWSHSDSSTPVRRGFPYSNIRKSAGTSSFRLRR